MGEPPNECLGPVEAGPSHKHQHFQRQQTDGNVSLPGGWGWRDRVVYLEVKRVNTPSRKGQTTNSRTYTGKRQPSRITFTC